MTTTDRQDWTRKILDYHFGIRMIDSPILYCAGCTTATLWPCAPALLAQSVKEDNHHEAV